MRANHRIIRATCLIEDLVIPVGYINKCIQVPATLDGTSGRRLCHVPVHRLMLLEVHNEVDKTNQAHEANVLGDTMCRNGSSDHAYLSPVAGTLAGA